MTQQHGGISGSHFMWVQSGPLLLLSIGLKPLYMAQEKRVNGVKFDPTYSIGGPMSLHLQLVLGPTL